MHTGAKPLCYFVPVSYSAPASASSDWAQFSVDKLVVVRMPNDSNRIGYSGTYNISVTLTRRTERWPMNYAPALIGAFVLVVAGLGISYVIVRRIEQRIMSFADRHSLDSGQCIVVLFMGLGTTIAILFACLSEFLLGYPPATNDDRDRLGLAVSERLTEYDEEKARIDEVLSRVGNLDKGTLHDELSDVRLFLDKLHSEAMQEKAIIEQIHNDKRRERDELDRIRDQVDELSKLSSTQIRAIASMLTADAKKQTARGVWIGALVSLPIGIIASLTAALLLLVRRRSSSTICLGEKVGR